MHILSSTNRLLMLAQFMVTDFAPWYAFEKPRAIVNDYFAYCKALTRVIGFAFLIKTLLQPWKNIVDEYPSNHLDFNGIIMAFTTNLTSRIIGCIVRLMFIVAGIAFEVALFTTFVAYLLLWITFPLTALLCIRHVLVTVI